MKNRKNGWNQASKSLKIWRLNSAHFFEESNFRNKQSMVQWRKGFMQLLYHRERAEHKSHAG